MGLVTKKSECKTHKEGYVKSPKEIKKRIVKKSEVNDFLTKPFRYSLASLETMIYGGVYASEDFINN